MTDTTARPSDGAAAQSETPEAKAADRERAGAGNEAMSGDIATPDVDPVQALTREVADYKDRLLRTLAEMENLRRRTEREVADARAYAIASFARDVLAVADNMDRALQALDAELREKADAGIKALLDGVELTERELLKALEKHGVRKFEPVGQRFDPNVHQAMYEVPDESVPSGQVLHVVQAGYMIGDRMLRPALVGVSKGGPKQKPAADGQANDNVSGTGPKGAI
jgi:molecular chaperone GrpE